MENPILLPLLIETDDGTKYEAEVRIPLQFQDRLAFETKFHKASTMLDRGIQELSNAQMLDPDYPPEERRFIENPAFDPGRAIQHEHLAFLAWCDLRRRGIFTGPFEVLKAQIDDMAIDTPRSPADDVPIDDEVDPLEDPTPPPSATTGSSPSSSRRRSGTRGASAPKSSS